MQIDEDTHPANTLRRAAGSSILEKRTVEVCLFARSHDRTARTSPSTFPFLPSSQCQRADPGSLFRGQRQWKPGFLIFGNRKVLPVARQHLCHSLNSPSTSAPQRFVISEAGYRGGRFCCQHPKMTKPTKSDGPVLALSKLKRAGGFCPAAPVDFR